MPSSQLEQVSNERTDDHLREWCVENLRDCERWLVRRRLHVPAHEALHASRLRYGKPDAVADDAASTGSAAEAAAPVHALTTTLADDLGPLLASLRRAGIARVEVRIVAGILVPLFDGSRFELNLPEWLVSSMQNSLFEPGPLFPRARPTSTTWLLFQSFVLGERPCRIVSDYYEVMDYS